MPRRGEQQIVQRGIRRCRAGGDVFFRSRLVTGFESQNGPQRGRTDLVELWQPGAKASASSCACNSDGSGL